MKERNASLQSIDYDQYRPMFTLDDLRYVIFFRQRQRIASLWRQLRAVARQAGTSPTEGELAAMHAIALILQKQKERPVTQARVQQIVQHAEEKIRRACVRQKVDVTEFGCKDWRESA